MSRWENRYRDFLRRNAAASPYLDDLHRFVDDTLRDRSPGEARAFAGELLDRIPTNRANEAVRAVVEARSRADDELVDDLGTLSGRQDLDGTAETRRQALLKEVFRRMDESKVEARSLAPMESQGPVTVSSEVLEEGEIVRAVLRNGGTLRVLLPPQSPVTPRTREAYLRGIPRAWWNQVQLVPASHARAGRAASAFRLPGEGGQVLRYRTALGKPLTAVSSRFLDANQRLGISRTRVMSYAKAKFGDVVVVPGGGPGHLHMNVSRVTVGGRDHLLVGAIPDRYREWAESRAVTDAAGVSPLSASLTDPKLREAVAGERARVAALVARDAIMKAQRELDDAAGAFARTGVPVVRVPTLPPDTTRFAPLNGIAFVNKDRRAVWVAPEYPGHPLNLEQKGRMKHSLKPLMDSGLVVDFASGNLDERCGGPRCVLAPSP